LVLYIQAASRSKSPVGPGHGKRAEKADPPPLSLSSAPPPGSGPVVRPSGRAGTQTPPLSRSGSDGATAETPALLRSDSDGSGCDAGGDDGFHDGMSGESNIMVTVRVRPILGFDAKKLSIVHVLDKKVVIVTDPGHAVSSSDGSQNVNYLHSGRSKEKRYAFDHVFDDTDAQVRVHKCGCR